jgi:hypothetical protein
LCLNKRDVQNSTEGEKAVIDSLEHYYAQRDDEGNLTEQQEPIDLYEEDYPKYEDDEINYEPKEEEEK